MPPQCFFYQSPAGYIHKSSPLESLRMRQHPEVFLHLCTLKKQSFKKFLTLFSQIGATKPVNKGKCTSLVMKGSPVRIWLVAGLVKWRKTLILWAFSPFLLSFLRLSFFQLLCYFLLFFSHKFLTLSQISHRFLTDASSKSG